jgi:nitrous oxidase accessory protein NosD
VLDLSTRGSPVARGGAQVQAAAVPSTASTIAVAGDFAYVASFDFGLQAFDIRTPDNPKFIGGVATPSLAFNVAARVTSRTFVYITDLAVGLHIVEGPPADAADSDGDGVIDFFDAFPRDPTETLDTDQDGIGDHADADDDNDGFDDAVELTQGTDPLNPKDFPVPLSGLDAANTLFVDAAAGGRNGDGSAERPYPSLSAALRAVSRLRELGFAERITVSVGAGMYSALQTREAFPLLLREGRVTLRGAGAERTTVDAAFFADVLDVAAGDIAMEGFTLRRGVNGMVANIFTSAPLEIAQNRILEHLFTGVSIGLGGRPMLSANHISKNGFRGVELFELADAEVSGNSISDNGEDGLFLFRASARIADNRISGNAQEGIQLDDGSTATVVANEVHANATTGIVVSQNSTATVDGNLIAANRNNGVTVQDRSFATIGNNEIFENGNRRPDETVGCVGAGILISDLETSAMLVKNHVSRNGFGIVVQQQANAEIRANIIEESSCHGVAITGALATINEGTITGDGIDGIFLESDGAGNIAKASIALEGSPLRITFNGDDGIDIEPGSGAQLNPGNILFEGNGDRDIEGAL